MVPTTVFHPGLSRQGRNKKLQYMGGNTGGSLEKAGREHTKRVTDEAVYLYKGTDMHFAGNEL